MGAICFKDVMPNVLFMFQKELMMIIGFRYLAILRISRNLMRLTLTM